MSAFFAWRARPCLARIEHESFVRQCRVVLASGGSPATPPLARGSNLATTVHFESSPPRAVPNFILLSILVASPSRAIR